MEDFKLYRFTLFKSVKSYFSSIFVNRLKFYPMKFSLLVVLSLIHISLLAQDDDDLTRNNMKLGSNFWNFAWGSGRADYFKDGVDWSTTTNPWNEDFLKDIQIYSVLRFMDQNPTNLSEQRQWEDRTQPKEDHYSTSRGGVAFEWQIDLCNKVGADLWLTIPHLTIEDYEADSLNNYWTKLASLVYDSLNDTLNVYVEYSNETWNGGFSQSQYTGQRGIEMGFGDEVYTSSFYFHIYAASRLHDVFLKEFAGEENRVKTVVSGQDHSLWGTERLIAAIKNQTLFNGEDTRLNPWQRIPDYLGIANYISTDDGAVSDIRRQWSESLEESIARYREHKLLIEDMGMNLVAYEGGQHYTNNAHTFSNNPESYGMYNEWLSAIDTLFELTCHYTHVGTWSSGGSWGAKSRTNQPIQQAHKDRALVHFVNLPVPGDGPLSVDHTEKFFSIYPNPSNDIITVKSRNWTGSTIVIQAINGKILLEAPLNKDDKNLDVSMLSPGIYLVSVIGADTRFSQKMIKN